MILDKNSSKTPADHNVMCFLFEHGSYPQILEDIFSYLDPNSLLSSSLACSKWNAFIDSQIFNSNARKMFKLSDQSQLSAHQIVADDSFVVVAFPSGVDVFCRKTGLFQKRLEVQVDEELSQDVYLSLSERYLVWTNGERMEVFDVRKGLFKHLEVTTHVNTLGDGKRKLKSLRMISEDSFILPEKNFTVGCYRISEDTLQCQFLWEINSSHNHLMVKGDDVVLCENFPTMHAIRLARHSTKDGSKSAEMWLEEQATSIVGMTYSGLVCILLVRRSDGSRRLVLCDLERGSLLKGVDVNNDFSFASMWADSSMLFVATLSKSRILVWDLRSLLRCDAVSSPDRIIKTTEKFGGVFVPCGDRVIYPECSHVAHFVVDFNFWRR